MFIFTYIYFFLGAKKHAQKHAHTAKVRSSYLKNLICDLYTRAEEDILAELWANTQPHLQKRPT